MDFAVNVIKRIFRFHEIKDLDTTTCLLLLFILFIQVPLQEARCLKISYFLTMLSYLVEVFSDLNFLIKRHHKDGAKVFKSTLNISHLRRYCQCTSIGNVVEDFQHMLTLFRSLLLEEFTTAPQALCITPCGHR